MKALFIHRSVGHNLIVEGNLPELLGKHGIELDDYDNNSGTLTKANGSALSNAITIPGNNTNPDNLEQYFINWDTILDNYDLIIIKSCYPNSHIKNGDQLKKIQESYQTIFEVFKAHRKQLILLTSPPLRPLFTNQQEATLIGKLDEWLVGNEATYVRVLDFHALLANSRGKHRSMLRREYRRWLPFDNHPNKKANQQIAPLVAEFIAK